MIISIYRTLGITLHTVRADYDCWWSISLLYQGLNRTIRSAALPYPKHAVPLYSGMYMYLYLDQTLLFTTIQNNCEDNAPCSADTFPARVLTSLRCFVTSRRL